MKRQSSNDSWNIALLGVVLFLAIIFFHWRENVQEEVIIKKDAKDEEQDNRIKKLEDGAIQAEVKIETPTPRRVKFRRKRKKVTKPNSQLLPYTNGSPNIPGLENLMRKDN